jgi:predicted Rossmann-fold nucleotide-binding protein
MSSPKTPFMSRSVFARPTLRAVNDCVAENTISPEDLQLIRVTDSVDDALAMIRSGLDTNQS